MMTSSAQDKPKEKVTAQQLTEDLRRLGLAEGHLVLVHSSLSSLGRLEGGEHAVIDALLAAVAPGGTVMVPTLTGNEALGPENPPVFNPDVTPCWTGRIPETFRHRARAVRSLHPTHSVAAIGPQADYLTGAHLQSPTPCGLNSPYKRLAELDGWVLMLGVDLESCTLLHTAEELAGSPYHMQPQPVEARVFAGEQWQTVSTALHAYGTPRRFMRLEPELLARGIERQGTVGQATARLLRAGALLDYATQRLQAEPDCLLAG